MPIQAPPWTDFLNCPICCNEFAANQRVPISLGCGHTICKLCLTTVNNRLCPFDQTLIVTDIDTLPINYALLQLVSNGGASNAGTNKSVTPKDFEQVEISQNIPSSVQKLDSDDLKCYQLGKKCIEDLALHLKSSLNNGNLLTRPMQRKLVTLVNCQLMEEEGRVRALRAARSLGERTVTELILQHQNPQQLSSNLWAAVRTRGCQFLGPAMQEEVLKLVLLALEEGCPLSRKVLVMFVVQSLTAHFPQASKTSIGHVVQLLYRASCFKVSKREADSSLMQLKEEFRTYDALRREHDAQIVQIATEAGLRIAPEQWSSLLYGDISHKSHMQSIIDKLQTPQSFSQSVQELVIASQRTNDPAKLANLQTQFQHLANIDPGVETAPWEHVAKALDAVRLAVSGLVQFLKHHGVRKSQDSVGGGPANTSNKYKISLCRDLNVRRVCPRGSSCTFAHSEEELERFRARNRGKHIKTPMPGISPNHLPGNSKKTIHMPDDFNVLSGGQMRYMPPANIACRGYGESPNCNMLPLALSPGGPHSQQMLHQHHSPIQRQQSSTLNGLLGPPQHYEPRFSFASTPTQSGGLSNGPHTIAQSRNSAREFLPHPNSLTQQQQQQQQQPQPMRNITTPPNFNVNSNIHNHTSPMASKGFCNMLPPADAYQSHPAYFGNEATNSIHSNNADLSAAHNNMVHAGSTNLWEHQYLSPSQQQQQQQPPGIGPSSKNPNRPITIANATSDTSFYEKKPPNNINIDLDLKQINEMTVDADSMAMDPYSFRQNNNMSFWNKPLAEGNGDKHTFRESSNFVRSDSILDDDGCTFDVPTGSSMNSRFGPICPKRNVRSSNWNNWIPESDPNSNTEFLNNKSTAIGDLNYAAFSTGSENRTLELQSLQTEVKPVGNPTISPFNFNRVNISDERPPTIESNNNTNINKNSGACDNVLYWNSDVNANAPNFNATSSYWSNSNEATPLSSHNERLKQQQLLGRRPQLISEDSFEGGIDRAKMSELEKNLVDIVEVGSNPDDSGITLE